MKNVTLKIAQINDKYVVENGYGKVWILNKRNLKWNLRHVFGLSGEDVLAVMVSIGMGTFTEIVLESEKVA